MGVRLRVVTLGALVLGGTSAAQAQTMLSLAEVLARARERAPQVVRARLALEEQRARLAAASRRPQSNPELEAAIGNRQGDTARTTDVEVGLVQRLEPGSRRSARMAGAEASLATGRAEVEATTRDVLQRAASVYYRSVHALERVRLLTASQALAAHLLATADRRFKAGDIAVLDVNIARASLARARAERAAAEAARASALGELKAVLGIEGEVALRGELATSPTADLPTLLTSAASRPDVNVLEAAVHEAEAELRLGQSLAKPDYGLGVRFGREEGDTIVLGGLTLTLPMFAKGQEIRAAAAARSALARADLEAARVRARLEVQAAFEAYERRMEAIRVLQTDASGSLDENEQLSARSFEVGQLGLPELLLIRREILETRVQYLDALLEAALARVDLDTAAGVLR